MSYVIAKVIQHGAAVKEFHIRLQDGGLLPAWLAGSHIVLQFASADGTAFENHYSLIGEPGETDTYRIAVQREDDGKGGSRCMHDEMTAGHVVSVSGPFNSFPLAAPHAAATPAPLTASQPRVLLVAGGIGITPMVSMAYALSAAGRPFELHYLARKPERLVLLDELRAIPGAAIVTHVSQDSGRADLAALLGEHGAGDSVYACGPVALLQGLAEAGEKLGWPSSAMHFESFGARAQTDDEALTIELTLSQMTVEVQPGTSILDALIAADVFVSYDCKRGECASCYTQVLEGQPRHRDVCLTPAMREQGMCTCVSWAAPGRLVLEL
jgi:vanillate O-demethylase ferredoxin subunit